MSIYIYICNILYADMHIDMHRYLVDVSSISSRQNCWDDFRETTEAKPFQSDRGTGG